MGATTYGWVDRYYSSNLKPWSARTLYVYAHADLAQKYSVSLQEIFVSREHSQEENSFFCPGNNSNNIKPDKTEYVISTLIHNLLAELCSFRVLPSFKFKPVNFFSSPKQLFFCNDRCGSNRHLTVRKSDGERTSSISGIHLAQSSCQQIEQLSQRFPLTSKERQDLTPKVERTAGGGIEISMSTHRKSSIKLPSPPPSFLKEEIFKHPFVVLATKKFLLLWVLF
jgi:hypothetical protein